MGCLVVVGGAFGDEGKGKIISYVALKDNPKIAVRGGVGPNAGHTVVCNGKTIKLRMLPSAVVNRRTRLMIGAGVLVDPRVLLKEMKETGTSSRTRVDYNCAVIEKRHITLDKEGHLKNKIGTTGTGTGPANSDRVMRLGRIASQEPSLKPFVEDVTGAVNSSLDRDELVIVEGTQGTLLSLYFGDYPFVTSKDVSASGICSDVGIGPKRVDDVLVVFKSYFTRVGSGDLPGELETDETIKRGWQEFGSVTGRLRRAAPFNFELARRAVKINSATQIALTKLDTVFPEVKGLKDYARLSRRARDFISNVESELGSPVVYIGTGAESTDIIDRRSRKWSK
ncbi:MAG: adenylosuccinate synthetase [Nitrososphaerota archaeon]|nr:adenylosuccinate synthetase [Nitrososphaerota archaeon]